MQTLDFSGIGEKLFDVFLLQQPNLILITLRKPSDRRVYRRQGKKELGYSRPKEQPKGKKIMTRDADRS